MTTGVKFNIVFICSIVLIFSSISYAQTTEDLINNIEKLLLDGKILEAKGIFNNNNLIQIIENQTDQNEFKLKKIKRLQHLFNYNSYIPFNDSIKFSEYLLYQKELSSLYIPDIAGDNASEMFAKFMELSDSDPNRSIDYLVTAKYFYKNNLTIKTTFAENVYDSSIVLFNSGNLNETVEFIDSNQYNPGDNPKLVLISNKTNRLKEKILRRIKSEEDKQFYWKNKETVNSKIQLSFVLSLFRQSALDSAPIETYNPDSAMTFHLKTSSRFNFGGGLELLYPITGNLSIGIDGYYYKNKYESKSDLRLINYDFSLNTLNAHLKALYFLRDKVGVRPFISLGGGIYKYKLKENELIEVWDETGTIKTEFYTIENDFSTFQILGEFGLQIIFKSEKTEYLTVKTIFTQNIDDDPLINKFNIGFSASVGYSF